MHMPTLDPSIERTDHDWRTLSRRAFLALATVAGGGVASGHSDGDRVERRSPDDIVLRIEDLTEPDSYVTWSVRAEDAPLPRYLSGVVDSFVPSGGATTGYLATEAAEGPDAVESAVYPDTGMQAVGAAIDRWVRRERDGPGATTLRHEPGRGVVRWDTISEESIEVLRIERFPRNTVGFVGASGTTVGVDPRSVVGTYADTMRARAAGETTD